MLSVGTKEPRKNLRTLLQAWKIAARKKERLVLVGPSGWGEGWDVELRSAGKVMSIGFVDRSSLRALYAGAAAFCWPSLREGFGFPVLEAMAEGCPVITSRGTSTEEIVGDSGVLVDPTAAPAHPVMVSGRTSVAKIEELTRIPSEVQDTLITMLSEKTLPVPELATEVQAERGFSLADIGRDGPFSAFPGRHWLLSEDAIVLVNEQPRRNRRRPTVAA